MGDIPIIDFGQIGLDKQEHTIEKCVMERVGMKVKNALSTAGFCYLKNHGINQNLIDGFASSSRVFFDQPVPSKTKYASGAAHANFGWIAVEREKLNPNRPGDLKEAFIYCPANEPDSRYWPNGDNFQNLNKEMFAKCTALSFRLCDALSISLGLDKTFIRDAHKMIGYAGNQTTLRSLYYPPIPNDSGIKPRQIRLGEHSDYGSISFVFQDDIGGLEVNNADKGYIPASPLPGTIVVNIGDLMERWTADALIATKHRVLIPEKEMKRKMCRQSTAFFLFPDDDYVVECLDGSNKYEPISSLNYLHYKFSSTMDTSH